MMKQKVKDLHTFEYDIASCNQNIQLHMYNGTDLFNLPSLKARGGEISVRKYVAVVHLTGHKVQEE